MSIEALIAQALKRKLRVANLYEGTDGVWRCALWRDAKHAPDKWVTGKGVDAAAALSDALANRTTKDKAKDSAAAVSSMFEDILG